MRSLHLPRGLCRGKRWGFGGGEYLIIFAVLGLLATLIVPAVFYAMFLVNKGQCGHKLKSLAAVTKGLHASEDSPIGDRWLRGNDWTPSEETYNTPVLNDTIRQSRLAFWRMIADTKLLSSPGGPQAFICPGSAEAKVPAVLSVDGTPQRDFKNPKKSLFYSMFNQSQDGIVPKYGAETGFIIMGDRSPRDDGYALDANSANHRWGDTNTGQNLCYSSGNVKWVETTNVGIDEDEIYARGSDVTAPITKSTVPVDTNDTILMPVAE